MKKIIIILLSSLLIPCEDSVVTLTMEDSWGDGWNGNTFCLNSECTTLQNGSYGTEEFCIDLSVENSITCGGGNWQSEVFWSLSDPQGVTIATGGAPFDGCVGGTCENEIIESLQIEHNGLIRDYYLYIPSSIQDNAPLIFLLHGYSGSAGGILNYSGMIEVAAEHGFALCVPQGTSDDDGYNYWNVGYAFHQNETVDDVDFLVDLAEHLHNEYQLDSQNTYVTGMSNGGDMSYMLACQANDVFRAIAPVAGTMMEEIYNTCDSSPVPVLEIHGTNDNVTLWDGDLNDTYWGPYPGMDEVIEFWVGQNECVNSENNFLLGMNTIHHRYFNCANNNEVWLYEVVNGGHDWPNYSSQEIWNFFTKFIDSIIGDLNYDDSVDILDVIILVNYILSPATVELDGADINNDGDVNVLDVVALVNIILSN